VGEAVDAILRALAVPSLRPESHRAARGAGTLVHWHRRRALVQWSN
jgi:hypothetical protein